MVQVPNKTQEFWSLWSTSDWMIDNNGSLNLGVVGSIKDPKVNLSIDFKDALLASKSNSKKVEVKIKDSQLNIVDNKLDSTEIIMTRVSERDGRSDIGIVGDLIVDPNNWQDNGIKIEPNITLQSQSLSVNSGYFQNTKLTNLELLLQGDWTPNSTTNNLELLGKVTVDEGQFLVSRTDISNQLPEVSLELTIDIDSKYRINGALIGSGQFTFANNYYFETDKSQLKVVGSSRLPKILGEIPLKLGAITLFDSYYELLPISEQRFFQEVSSIERLANKIVIEREILNNKVYLVPNLSITAIQYIPNSRFQELDELETQSANGFQGVMVRINGPLSRLEDYLDVAVFDISTKYPKSAQITLKQYFSTPLQQNDNDRERSEAFEWITPYALKNIDSSSIELIGEQQTNVLFRKSISPIERRIAKNTGLYDLKVDYDLGKSLRQRLSSSENSSIDDDNLLGVNFIWGLLSDRLLLRLKTDVNTNTQVKRDNDLKLTEFELTYLLSQQLSINFTHISDYNETSDFHPLLSISFLNWF